MGLLSFIYSLIANDQNAKNIASTNETNLKIARETNAANAEQANLAYQRSLPYNQVNNLIGAGMSKAGALSSLTGGGTYSAPVMQGATMQAPQIDVSSIASALERLENIPSNVQQYKITDEQLKSLQIDNENKQKAEKRAQDLHEFNVWKETYGKESALKLDAAKSLIMNALLDQDKDVSSYKSFGSMVKDLGLSNAKELRNLPSMAWSQIETSVRDGFADARAEREQQNRDTASYDSHVLSTLEQTLKRIDVKYYDREKDAQLINLLRIGQGLIEDNNIKFQDRSAKEMENYVREAGIDNERDARALAEYVNKLAQEDELDIQGKRAIANRNTLGVHNQFRVVLRDLGELLMKVKL